MKLPGRRQKPSQTGRQPVSGGRAKVFSYYASSTPDSSRISRNQPVKKPFNWHRVPSLLALIRVLISVVYGLSLDTNPRISVLSSQDQVSLLQATSAYQTAAEEILKSSITNRSKLTINTKSVAAKLKQRYPELADVSVTVPLASHRLVFELEPVEPALILSSANGSYVIDINGFAVVATRDVPTLSKMSLPQVIDETGLDIKAGTNALPDEQTNFILELARQLSAQDILIDQLTLPAIPNELRLRAEGEKYVVKFDMQGDVRKQAGTYLATRQHLKKSNTSAKEYIDVRVEERAFIR